MKQTEDYIRGLAYNAHIVKGDLDAGLDFPDQKILKIGELTIGLIHGHQIVPWGDSAILANHARAIGVDILVHGHSHAAEILKAEGNGAAPSKSAASNAAIIDSSSSSSSSSSAAASSPSTLLLNPGSLTGAYSPFTTQIIPSFFVLAISGPSVLIYQYEILQGQEVTVTKTEWKKTK